MRTLARALVVPFILTTLSGCIHRVVEPYPTPGAQAPREEPPPGMVEVSVVSEYDDQTWDVIAGGDLVCSTPCTQWVRAAQGLRLVANDGDRLFVPGLGPEAAQTRHAVLVAEGTCEGKHTTGIVFTALGGMGVVTSIPFVAVGCSDVAKRGGLCTAGLITAGVSLPLTAVAIWMMVDALPKAHIVPFKPEPSTGQPPVSLAIVPNGIVGTF